MDLIPLPSNVVRNPAPETLSDDPRLDAFIGEVLVVRGFEWIGRSEPYMGVRLYCHRVEGEHMEKSGVRIRAFTAAVMRWARDLAKGNEARTVKLEQWPMVRVVGIPGKYGIEPA